MNTKCDCDSDDGATGQVPILPSSPVQEHHIDFLLEEEFACNPRFLEFFVDAAKEHFKPVSNGLEEVGVMQPCPHWDCKAIRSVTTGKGETDVLAIYQSAEIPKRIAILIEDKIRAGFQRAQPERYCERGEQGQKTGQWNFYWTCLVAPDKYADGNVGFDTRVSLEKLATFFSGNEARSEFKREVIERAIKHSEIGPPKDETMTWFRAFYVHEAAAFFSEGEVTWPKARDASDFWGERWFDFKGGGLPAGAVIGHKSEQGFIDLSFSNTKVAVLERLLAKCPHPPEITAKKTGNSASVRIHVKPISDFSNCDAAKPVVREAFQSIRDLIAFYSLNKGLITEEMSTAATPIGSDR